MARNVEINQILNSMGLAPCSQSTMRLKSSKKATFIHPFTRMLACLVCIPTLFSSPITGGNILMPVGTAEIVELKAGSLAKVQTISLPVGYYFPSGANIPPTVLVRSADHAIMVNAIDHPAGDKPVLLVLDSTGKFVSVLHPEYPLAAYLNQLVFDPADPSQKSVLGGVYPSGNVDAMNPFTSSVSAKIPHPGALLHGIAIDHSGNIYVGDPDTGSIKVYSSGGTFIKDFTTVTHAGTHAMEGMTLDAVGNLYVTQATSWTVLKYSSAGTLLAVFTAPHMYAPWGVFYNPYDHLLYVGNSSSSYVTVLKTDGTFVADDFTLDPMFHLDGLFTGQATVVPLPTPIGIGACTAVVTVSILGMCHPK